MLNAEDTSSCSEISVPPVKKPLSPKLKEDPSYNLLFKFSVIISSGKDLNYSVYFLNFPTLQVTDNNEGSIIFPMSVDELSSHTSPSLEIDSFQNGIDMGSASLIVSECVYKICEKIDKGDSKYPLESNLIKTLWLIKENHRENEIKVDFKLDCIGQTIIQDIKEIIQVLPEPELEIDEYTAELNGHTLNIKMLRKPKQHDNDYLDDSNKEILRNNSQIMFQMPSNQALCNRSPQNAYMYNVGTCKQGQQHGHEDDKIKVLPGKSSVEDGKSKDTFVIKLGKKAHDTEGKSRLELELKAPKPLGPEDFKKPSRDATTQTEAQAAGKKGKGKKKKGKK